MFRLCFVARTESSSNILFDWPCLLGAYCTTKIKCFRFSKSHTVGGVKVQLASGARPKGAAGLQPLPPPLGPQSKLKKKQFLYTW